MFYHIIRLHCVQAGFNILNAVQVEYVNFLMKIARTKLQFYMNNNVWNVLSILWFKLLFTRSFIVIYAVSRAFAVVYNTNISENDIWIHCQEVMALHSVYPCQMYVYGKGYEKSTDLDTGSFFY